MKSQLVWMTFGLLAVACGSGDKNRLLSRLESAGDRCPTPGVVVVSGLDDDGDGTLDDDEIDTTDLICSNDTLTRVDALAPGSVCPAGGTAVNVGVDDNDDGLLEDPEIDHTQNICKGTLVRSTELGPEDPACYGLGGVRLEIGVDDNGDDVLGVDEVDTTSVTCNVPGTAEPPAGPPGTAQILVNGGASSGGRGGNGGSVVLEHASSGGGSLAIFRTGVVDTAFTLLTRTPVPGATPSAPAASLTIPEITLSLAAPTPAPAAGTLYATGFAGGNFRLMVSNGGNAGDEPPITSLTIGAGVVVTFGGGAESPLRLVFSDDVINNGSIVRNGVNKGLQITARAYAGGAGSSIDLRGAAGATGGAGGSLTFILGEVFVNEGTFDVSGGLGTATGGASGTITVDTAAGSLHNAGTLRASGGDVSGATGTGGNAGGIVLRATGGRLANRGNLVAAGGPGKNDGGEGGTIHLVAVPGDVVNGGELDVRGGSPVCQTNCRGGGVNGPAIDESLLGGAYNGILLISRGGGILSSGKLTATGGAVTNVDGCGAGGGAINLFVRSGGISTPSQGNVRVSGTIDASGGAGGNGNNCEGDGGGGGGSLTVSTQTFYPVGQEVLFLGYTDVHAHGGASGGTDSGTPGGSIDLRRTAGRGASSTVGAIVNHADLDLVGGAGGTGSSSGGQGGFAALSFNNTSISGVGTNRVINLGNVTADGAMGGYGGSGQSYAALLYGPEGVSNGGAISAMGGPGAAGSPFFGGFGGDVVLSSDVGTVDNTGTIKVTGGSAFVGRNGGAICLEGTYVTNTKALDASGGSGTSTNGNGNQITLTSYNQPTANSGALTVAAGSGTGAAGTPGLILVDVAQGRCYGNER